MRKTKEQIQYFIDNTKDILFQIDLEGNYTFGNVAAERVTGYPLRQLLQMNMRQLVLPEYHDSIGERLRQRITDRVEEELFEIQIQHRDGHWLWLELVTSSVRNPEDRFKHGKARLIDIELAAYADKVVLAVRDDGLGIPLKLPLHKGMGLRTMQYRIGLIGGSLTVQRRTYGGTEVACTVEDGLLPPERRKIT